MKVDLNKLVGFELRDHNTSIWNQTYVDSKEPLNPFLVEVSK